jgi:DNA repair photolyase
MPPRKKRPDALKRISNPPNPWLSHAVEYLGEPPKAELHLHEDLSRTILAHNNSPDVPFTWSVNPYRGCVHGCAYCYARPGHEVLGFGAGSDFDRHITFKPRAAELLREAFDKRSWKGEVVVFSGVTDCYQPLEASLELTRQCLEVCLEYRNPVAIITKSALIERDAELLAQLHREAYCQVLISIPFFDPEKARAIEPTVPTPARRFKTIRRLSEAGVPTGVNVAPIIPGLSDEDIPQILEAAYEAGARYAGKILVRLPGPVKEVFVERLQRAFPHRAKKILHAIESCRGGGLSDARFGHRMRGQGPRWEAIVKLFEQSHDRLGYGEHVPVPKNSCFRRPSPQLTLAL